MSRWLEIIIPARNPSAELSQTIASLAAQTDCDFSVLLSNALTTTGAEPFEDAKKQLAAAGVQVRDPKPPSGLKRVEHWNWAHSQAQAEWLKPLVPGGRLKPGYVAQLKQRIQQQPKAQFIRCELEAGSATGRSGIAASAPFAQTSLSPAEFLNHFPGQMKWIANSTNVAYRQLAWLALGGYSPQIPSCASLNLNAALALHHGLENIPEPLAILETKSDPRLNEDGLGRVNLSLELWLILRQAQNYCLSAKLPWPQGRLLSSAFMRARGCWRVHTYGR